LNESHYDVFIQSLSKANLINRNVGVIKPALQNTLIAADDFIAIHATIAASDEKLLQMQQDLVFLFSQDQLLRKLNIEVSVTNTPGPTLVIRFATPKELTSTRRAIDGINSKIKRAFEGN
jgi:LPS O-antigen subunit length determinant protein (WzzB/FepE family)